MSDPTQPPGPPDPGETPPPAVPQPPADAQPPMSAPPPPPPPAAPGGASPVAEGAGLHQTLDVGAAFSWGWKKFTENLAPILIAVLVYLVVALLVTFVSYLIVGGILLDSGGITVNQQTGVVTVDQGSGFLTVLLVQALTSFVTFVLFAFLQAAVIRGALMLADGKKLEVGHMFVFTRFGTVLVAALIVAGLTAVGLLACYVGAVVVSFFTAFYLFFVLDQDAGAWESVKASFALVRANMGSVLLLLLGVLAAYVVGAILCGIGLIVTAPVALLALTFGYRRLQGQPIAA